MSVMLFAVSESVQKGTIKTATHANKIIHQCLHSTWITVDYRSVVRKDTYCQCCIENVNSFKHRDVIGVGKVKALVKHKLDL